MDDTHHVEISDEVTFFKLHDLDGDGYWTDRELRSLYGLERDVSSDAIHVNTIVHRAFQDLDTNHDGLISLQEYMVYHLPDWTEEEILIEKQWRLSHPSPELLVDHHSPAASWEENDNDDDHIPNKFKVQ
ncbi:uncharacterized protein BX664DRAFT_334230 [Halteromyces radiatus]|uniref:uncharacterized protein n=1 Tax=Halteromyces radiatus TaxID=101107 RepID=UPI002220AC2A|nr:uncharacterized protein BX664DRAFT_334230 [Halteromyces radiatus]KAI8089923.1 hypothetical protein BX664DRAFT_334230 [Halteromyces radiatus]